MKIQRDAVVSIEYVLRDDDGKVLDQSQDAPMAYLHGHGNIVPGLERQLEGLEVGTEAKATVAPAEGYGERNEQAIVQVERSQLPEELDPQVGMVLSGQAPNGQPVPFWVVKVEDAVITLDGNHPLAGQTLHFQVAVKEVREASPEEIQQGHAGQSDS